MPTKKKTPTLTLKMRGWKFSEAPPGESGYRWNRRTCTLWYAEHKKMSLQLVFSTFILHCRPLEEVDFRVRSRSLQYKYCTCITSYTWLTLPNKDRIRQGLKRKIHVNFSIDCRYGKPVAKIFSSRKQNGGLCRGGSRISETGVRAQNPIHPQKKLNFLYEKKWKRVAVSTLSMLKPILVVS